MTTELARRSGAWFGGARAALGAGFAVGLSLTSLGCSSGSGGGSSFFIEGCSLGCNSGEGGETVFCQVINVARNQDVVVLFSQPISAASLGAGTFRIVQSDNGTAPAGQLFVDAGNPRRLIYRPALTFDGNGSPIFGLQPNTSYQVTIPGAGQADQGPFVRSVDGNDNQSRLSCTIFTDQPVQDPVPGPPGLRVFADVVTSYDGHGDPLTIVRDQELTMDALDTVDVLRSSDVTFVFNEIMNPATIANNVTGESFNLAVQLDADGLVETDNDRTDVDGLFRVVVDQAALSTTAVFTPTLGFPTGGPVGAPPTNPIFVNVSSGATDIVGESVTDDPRGLTFGFFPERQSFDAIELPRPGGETFDLSAGDPGSLEDAALSGADWGGGRLAPGEGGGSGRLGDLTVRAGETVVLDADGTTFPLPGRPLDVLGNEVGGDQPGQGANTIEVTDGAFEFARLEVEPGGVLRIEGDQPARLFSRGPLTVGVSGLIDVAGGTPEAHDSSIALPSLGVRVFEDPGGGFTSEGVAADTGGGGPGGGDGGFGADRWDHTGNTAILSLLAPSEALDITAGAGMTSDPSARDGDGVGGMAEGAGRGGTRFPTDPFPATDTNTGGDLEVFRYNVDPMTLECIVRQVGGAGSGGGYALVGSEGVAASSIALAEFPASASNLPANTPGGDPGSLLVPANEDSTGYVVRTLEFFGGNLRGGAGGGGGGNHAYLTSTSDFNTPPDCFGNFVSMVGWHDHSGAAGGGGGGAIQLHSGVSIAVDGVVDASGGDGGSGAQEPPFNPTFGRFAMPGGGGSGGAVYLGAPSVELGPSAGRLDVSGGAGGATNFAEPSEPEILARGGNGSPGLVRIEDSAGTAQRSALAPSVLPVGDAGNDFALDWMSVVAGQWTPSQTRRPESLSASTSCWVRPAGGFLSLNFDSDTGPASADQGWNMDVVFQADLTGLEVLIPFRGTNTVSVDIPDFVGAFGNGINAEEPIGSGSPVAVRFQGARIVAPVGTEFCGLELDDALVQPGSVTPWVDHPDILNSFDPPPNAMRFTVVFDRSVMPFSTDGGNPTTVPAVRGVTNLLIRASPE